ncbi:PEP-CTERM sorting domain-containing protein [Luteolibacter flavescens]|uniref:PEP-CTERM sorting domain-containing protein n=1 Tax=Luteolibacter flavescens TaxID=1859460 RepID=A0ABT3FV51_9BACT|nr:PEP-CTERM sorting domain-containing protein [Luteolibacter flavescens]MCW1887432.1 PEP-CTERM sorting domain-containing protein [Luteolibacter flavescens]
MTPVFRSLRTDRLCLAALAAGAWLAGTPAADAASVAYNFSETNSNPSQSLDTTTPKGPLGSSIWNDSYVTTTGGVATGTETNLVDNTGANTGMSISWTSKETWFGDGGGTTQDQRIVLGYLDDGDQGGANPGVFVTLSNISYSLYNVYLILASDAGTNTTYTSQDFLLNGSTWIFGGASATTATAFASMESTSANGTWTRAIAGVQTGNYALATNLSGSTLTIDGLIGAGGARGSLAGIIIEQVPEPSAALLAAAGGMLLFRRRRND